MKKLQPKFNTIIFFELLDWTKNSQALSEARTQGREEVKVSQAVEEVQRHTT